MNASRARTVCLIALVMLATTLPWISCAGEKETSHGQAAETVPESNQEPIKAIETVAGFEHLIESTGDRLLMFDFHAAWCRP